MSARSLIGRFAPAVVVHRYREMRERRRVLERAGLAVRLTDVKSERCGDWIREAQLHAMPPDIGKRPGVIVDVGANVGKWSEAMLHLFSPPRLIAVEPTPTTFTTLNARLGGDDRVRLHEVAVGAMSPVPRASEL